MRHLEGISESYIFEHYQPAIRQENDSTFDDFTQEHRDAYIRLKVRGVDQARPPVYPELYVKRLEDRLLLREKEIEALQIYVRQESLRSVSE